MQPNCVDFHRFKPVNISAQKCPVGRPKKKPVDQPLTTDCTSLTITISCPKLLKINCLIDTCVPPISTKKIKF